MKYLGPPQSGALANVVYSRNQFGQYTRDRVSPTQSSSAAAIAARALFATAVAAWAALTADERAQWDAYAATIRKPDNLGQMKVADGRLTYIAAVQSTGGTSVSPGGSAVGLFPASPALAFGDPAPLYNLNAIYNITAPCKVNYYSNGMVTGAVNSPPGKGRFWKLLGTIDLTAVPPGQYSSLIQPAWDIAFGPAVVGMWTFVRLKTLNASGSPSAPVLLGRIQF